MQKRLLTKFNIHLWKNSPESGHRGNLPQHNKGHIWQTHSKHHSQWWKTESISSMIRNRTRMSTLTTIIEHNLVSPNHCNQRRKRNKRNPNWKRRECWILKFHYFINYEILCLCPNTVIRRRASERHWHLRQDVNVERKTIILKSWWKDVLGRGNKQCRCQKKLFCVQRAKRRHHPSTVM